MGWGGLVALSLAAVQGIMSSDEDEEGRIGFQVTEEDEDNEFYGRHRK